MIGPLHTIGVERVHLSNGFPKAFGLPCARYIVVERGNDQNLRSFDLAEILGSGNGHSSLDNAIGHAKGIARVYGATYVDPR